MSNPYGAPPSAPPPRSRTGLYVALTCGCLLLAGVVLAVAGAGAWFLSRGGGEDPDLPTATSQPTDDPTTAIETAGPIETPSEDPTDDPPDDPSSGDTFTITVSSPEEGTTLDTSDETLTTENGKFVGVAISITNHGEQEIGLAGANFRFYDEQGVSHPLRYASFTTSGPQLPAGESATALLYADVPEDMVLASVGYTDEVATNGQEITFRVG